jgi:hypothetical protein
MKFCDSVRSIRSRFPRLQVGPIYHGPAAADSDDRSAGLGWPPRHQLHRRIQVGPGHQAASSLSHHQSLWLALSLGAAEADRLCQRRAGLGRRRGVCGGGDCIQLGGHFLVSRPAGWSACSPQPQRDWPRQTRDSDTVDCVRSWKACQHQQVPVGPSPAPARPAEWRHGDQSRLAAGPSVSADCVGL